MSTDQLDRSARTAGTRQWRGVIEEYRELLEIPQDTPAVTLREGGTPLVHSEWLSGLTGAEVHLKVEGDNPKTSRALAVKPRPMMRFTRPPLRGARSEPRRYASSSGRSLLATRWSTASRPLAVTTSASAKSAASSASLPPGQSAISMHAPSLRSAS